MGNRLTKIYTRTGDDGTTGLGDGVRTPKDSLRIDAIGEIDELNSHIGVLLTEALPQTIHTCLTRVQHQLFDLGGELCMPGSGYIGIRAEHTTQLETALDNLNEPLPPLKEFILPGGSRAAALCHVARAVCRRVERNLVSLARSESVSPASLTYINRLSDLLFVMCRAINRHHEQQDVLWKPGNAQ